MVGQWSEEWIEFAKNTGEAPKLPEEVGEAKRQAFNKIMVEVAKLHPPLPDNIESRDLQVPDGSRLRAYKPIVESNEPLPMVLFIHGGGWFAGNLDTEDRTARMVCAGVSAVVMSVDYRCNADVSLEDEVGDCYVAFAWARSQAEAHGANPNKIVIWGGSAGGALAAAVAYRLVHEGKGDHIAGLASMNGLHCHPDATPPEYKHLMTSYVDNAGSLPLVSGDDTLSLYKHRNIEPPNTDIKIFPAAGGANAVKSFPPTYIITSDNDASRDDGTVFAAALKDAGVHVKLDNIMGLAHYFWTFPLAKANADFWSKLCDGIRWSLEQDKGSLAKEANRIAS